MEQQNKTALKTCHDRQCEILFKFKIDKTYYAVDTAC